MSEQLNQINSLSQGYRNLAGEVLLLHSQRLELNQRVTEQELDLQGKGDSVSAWTQRYISNSDNSDGVIAARNLIRSVNKLRIQVSNFKRNGDLDSLNKRITGFKGDLTDKYAAFEQADLKANQITSLIPALNNHFYKEDGLLDLYNRQQQTLSQLQQQLQQTHETLKAVSAAANQFIEYAQSEAAAAESKAQNTHSLSRSLIILLVAGATLLPC